MGIAVDGYTVDAGYSKSCMALGYSNIITPKA